MLDIVSVGVALLMLAAVYVMIKRDLEYVSSLPTLEQARLYVQEHYPEHAACFRVVQKYGGSVEAFWGNSVAFYDDYLECVELKVSIRIQPVRSER